MAWYEKMDVFKSFQTHFTTYETDNYVSSYVCMKLTKMGEQNCEISHINRKTSDPAIYKQTQNTLLHINVFGAQKGCGDLGWIVRTNTLN